MLPILLGQWPRAVRQSVECVHVDREDTHQRWSILIIRFVYNENCPDRIHYVTRCINGKQWGRERDSRGLDISSEI